MATELIYVELKSGYNDDGPAWIGNGVFNRTRRTCYFNGRIFKKNRGIGGNFYDLETGDTYWISGLKKRGSNRHWAGHGKIQIDRAVVDDYLDLKNWGSLPMDTYVVVELNNEPAKELSRALENQGG